MLTATEAEKIYKAGKQAKAQGKDLRNEIYELNGDWHTCKAFEMGYNGIEWSVQTYTRYGNLPEGPSYNFMDQRPERGVSVITEEWRQTIHGIMFCAANGNRKVVSFSGVYTGHNGGDGEPLVLPLKS